MPLWRVTLPPSPLLISKSSYLFIYLNFDLCLSAACVFPKHISKPTPHEQKWDLSSRVSGYVRDRGSLGLITHRLPQDMIVPGGRKAGLAWTAIEKDTFSDFLLLSSEIIWKSKVEMRLLWNICVPYMCLRQPCMLKLVSLSQNLRNNYVNYAY